MKKLLIMLTILLMSTKCYASQIQIDITGWTRNDISEIDASVHKMVYDAGYEIDYSNGDPIQVSAGLVTIVDDKITQDTAPTPFNARNVITTQLVRDEIDEQQALREQAEIDQAAQAAQEDADFALNHNFSEGDLRALKRKLRGIGE